MANLVKIQNLLNEPNVNLMTEFAMFNDTAFVWNVASGSATVANESGQQINGVACLRITPTSKTLINSGGNEMEVNITEDGNYLFSLRHKSFCATPNTQQVNIKVYVNSVLTDYTFVANTDKNNKYQTYCQVIPLLASDVVDFAFEFENATSVGVFKHYFDGLKFEFDNYGTFTPTTFTTP